MNTVRAWPVERAVLLAVKDHGARRPKDLLGPLHGRPRRLLARRERRQAVNLLRIEHGGKEDPGALELDAVLKRLALGVQKWPGVGVRLELLFAEFPVLNGRAFFAFAYLCINACGLLVGQPALIEVALAHELDRIDALVALAGDGVDGHHGAGFAGSPRFLPRRHALAELLDQLVGHRFMEGLFRRLHRRVPLGLCSACHGDSALDR